MNNLSYKIGYWSAISLTIIFIIWIISFVGIAISSPLFYWKNIDDYIVYVQSNPRFFQNLAYFFMLFFGPIYVIFINSFYDISSEQNKLLIRLSLLFALAFAITSSINYFIQLSSVRLSILKNNFEGLEYFIQANPDSISTSFVMLGWTLFLGLSSFFIFPVFSGNRLRKVLRIAFLFNGIFCFLAGIGFIFQIDLMTFLFVNIGIGGAIMVISITSIKLFKKLDFK